MSERTKEMEKTSRLEKKMTNRLKKEMEMEEKMSRLEKIKYE